MQEGEKGMKAPNCSICKKRPTEYEITRVFYNDPDANGTPGRTTLENLCKECYMYMRHKMTLPAIGD